MKSHIKKGDTVVVISGSHRYHPTAKNKKGIGKVLQIDSKRQRIIVKGINRRRIAQKRSQENPQGGFIEREHPIHRSNVMLKLHYDARLKRREQHP